MIFFGINEKAYGSILFLILKHLKQGESLVARNFFKKKVLSLGTFSFFPALRDKHKQKLSSCDSFPRLSDKIRERDLDKLINTKLLTL